MVGFAPQSCSQKWMHRSVTKFLRKASATVSVRSSRAPAPGCRYWLEKLSNNKLQWSSDQAKPFEWERTATTKELNLDPRKEEPQPRRALRRLRVEPLLGPG